MKSLPVFVSLGTLVLCSCGEGIAGNTAADEGAPLTGTGNDAGSSGGGAA